MRSMTMILYALLALAILNLTATLILAYSLRTGTVPNIRSAFRTLIEKRSSVTSPYKRDAVKRDINALIQ